MNIVFTQIEVLILEVISVNIYESNYHALWREFCFTMNVFNVILQINIF
jgi:hypothetical protein